MLKKILLGASIVTATTKIVTDICEAYEEAEEKPKGLSIIPFVLQVLARGGKDMKKSAIEKVKDIRRELNITKSQLTTAVIAGLTTGLTTGLVASSIVYIHYSNYNSKNNTQID